MEFHYDGYTFIPKETDIGTKYLHCEEKHVYVILSRLQQFFKDKSKTDVGFSDNIVEDGEKRVYAREIKGWVHIGCLKESSESFKQKYLEVIKFYNNKNKNNG